MTFKSVAQSIEIDKKTIEHSEKKYFNNDRTCSINLKKVSGLKLHNSSMLSYIF